MANSPRPMSPHLSIYRLPLAARLSILHRMTGVALYGGLGLLIIFLCTVAYMPDYYADLHACLGSIFGQLLLVGWVFSFFYHFYNGIRHLFWDMGNAMDVASVSRSNWVVLILTVLTTAISLFVAYFNMGVI